MIFQLKFQYSKAYIRFLYLPDGAEIEVSYYKQTLNISELNKVNRSKVILLSEEK